MTRNDSGSQLWHVSNDMWGEETYGEALFNMLDIENDTLIATPSGGTVNNWMSIDLLASGELGITDFYLTDGFLSLAIVNNNEYEPPSGSSEEWWEDKFNIYTKNKPTYPNWAPYIAIETYPVTCPGDFHEDWDVDGEDLDEYTWDISVLDMASFAENFGRIGCP